MILAPFWPILGYFWGFSWISLKNFIFLSEIILNLFLEKKIHFESFKFVFRGFSKIYFEKHKFILSVWKFLWAAYH